MSMATLDLLSVAEAAAELGLSYRRVARLCEQGRLGQKVGHRYVVARGELIQFSKIDRPPGNPAFINTKK